MKKELDSRAKQIVQMKDHVYILTEARSIFTLRKMNEVLKLDLYSLEIEDSSEVCKDLHSIEHWEDYLIFITSRQIFLEKTCIAELNPLELTKIGFVSIDPATLERIVVSETENNKIVYIEGKEEHTLVLEFCATVQQVLFVSNNRIVLNNKKWSKKKSLERRKDFAVAVCDNSNLAFLDMISISVMRTLNLRSAVLAMRCIDCVLVCIMQSGSAYVIQNSNICLCMKVAETEIKYAWHDRYTMLFYAIDIQGNIYKIACTPETVVVTTICEHINIQMDATYFNIDQDIYCAAGKSITHVWHIAQKNAVL